MSTPTLLWCDLETTGLDPTKDRIIEACFAVAPLDRPWEAKVVFDSVVRLPNFASDWARVTGKVYEMHHASGLMEAVRACVPGTPSPEEVEAELLQLVPEAEEQDDKWILAGSTITFDRGFLRRYMPALEARLSYRLYDTRVIQLFARGLGMPPIPKAAVHRARADVLESVECTRKVAEWLGYA